MMVMEIWTATGNEGILDRDRTFAFCLGTGHLRTPQRVAARVLTAKSVMNVREITFNIYQQFLCRDSNRT